MKAITNQSGLYRTDNSYYFRKSIPAHAQSTLGMTEVKKSFKKDIYRTAKVKAAYMNDYLERLFNKMKDIQPTSDEVNELIKIHFEKLLLDAEGDIYLDNEVWQEEYPIDAKERHDGKSPIERIEDLEEELKLHKEGLINQQAKPFYRDLAEELLKWKGYQYFDMSPVANQLCKGILEARMESLRMEIAQRRGEIAETDIRHPLLKDARNFLVNPDIDIQIEYEGVPYYKAISDSPALDEAIRKYLKVKGKSVKSRTLQDIEVLMGIVESYIGADKSVGEITVDNCRDLRDLIENMPKNFQQKYGSKGKSLEDVIKNEDYETISGKTIGKYWAWIKAFFEWCHEEGYNEIDPAHKFKVANVKSSKTDRNPFTKEQLQQYFTSPQYTGHFSDSQRVRIGDNIKKDTKYWIPLVALYTGARLGELITLQCKDVIKQDDFYYISINTDSDLKELKTEQSNRVIPLHPDLIKVGFIEYVDKQTKEHGQDYRLFHHISIPENRTISHNATKQLNNYMDAIGLDDNKLSFHSFRHCFIDGMRHARIDNERMDALSGHKDMSGKNARSIYGSGFKPQDLYPDICKMDFGLNLGHFQKGGEM